MPARLIVKICGLTREEDVQAALRAGADILGVVVGAPESPRCVDLARARRLRAAAGGTPLALLFRDRPLAEALAAAQTVGPAFLHLCGREGPEYRAALRAGVPGLRLLQTVGVPVEDSASAAWLQILDETLADPAVEHPVLDASTQGRAGGTGRALPFASLAALLGNKAHCCLLAGGLSPANVAEAVRRFRPAGVDASSGIETAPGLKDAKKMRRFVESARGVELGAPTR